MILMSNTNDSFLSQQVFALQNDSFTGQIIQVTEMIAKCFNANPCKEIEIAERLTG